MLRDRLAFDQAHRFQLQDHLMRAVVDFDVFGLNGQLWVFRDIIWIGDAGEFLDLAFARQLVAVSYTHLTLPTTPYV